MRGGNLHGKLKFAENTPARMVKKLKRKGGNSRIRIFNTLAYCLTTENAYLPTSLNNHFYSMWL